MFHRNVAVSYGMVGYEVVRTFVHVSMPSSMRSFADDLTELLHFSLPVPNKNRRRRRRRRRLPWQTAAGLGRA